jgi:excisionase family DNA binding protein
MHDSSDTTHDGDTRRSALYVRIPASEAAKLDRAAFELKASKQDLIAGLVARYVDPHSSAGLHALEELTGRRRVTLETTDDTVTVGRHSFQPAEPTEVLTLEQLAELLQTDEGTVRMLAEDGELPGRKLGDEWRFSRAAIHEWLTRSG